MKTFKVVLEKRETPTGNPFRRNAVYDHTSVQLRTWDNFPANSEEHVRELFADAKKKQLPNVEGYEIKSITEIDTAA